MEFIRYRVRYSPHRYDEIVRIIYRNSNKSYWQTHCMVEFVALRRRTVWLWCRSSCLFLRVRRTSPSTKATSRRPLICGGNNCVILSVYSKLSRWLEPWAHCIFLQFFTSRDHLYEVVCIACMHHTFIQDIRRGLMNVNNNYLWHTSFHGLITRPLTGQNARKIASSS